MSKPIVSEVVETTVEAITRDLKEETHFFVVNTGITKSAPINKPPTVLIPVQTTIARIQKKRRDMNRGKFLNGIRYRGFCVAPRSGYQKYHTRLVTNNVENKIAVKSLVVNVKILPKR